MSETESPVDRTRLVLNLVCNALEKLESDEMKCRVLMAACILLDLPVSMDAKELK